MIYKNAELHNVAELIEAEQGEGKHVCRVPDALRVTLNESAKANALAGAACEIRFNLRGGSARVVLRAEVPALAEVFEGAFQVSSNIVGTEPTEIVISRSVDPDTRARLTREERLRFDSSLTRIVLPYAGRVTLVDIRGDIEPPRDGQIPATRYLAYGSSITQGASAARPTGTYAMRTAERLGVDLLNVGFGSGCHCEPQMADYIAERTDWDLASLELGINMVAEFETGVFRERAGYLIERIAKAHPGKWVFCIDMFTFFWPEYPSGSRRVREYRRVVRQAVERLDMPKLVYVDGRKMLKDVSGLFCDLVHPGPSGMREIAANLSRVIARHRKAV